MHWDMSTKSALTLSKIDGKGNNTYADPVEAALAMKQ